MPNQEESRDGKPRPDKDRPSPDVERYATDGQAAQSTEPQKTQRPEAQTLQGDQAAKVGVTSDKQRDLVAPSRVNERDQGAQGDKPQGGDTLNFDDESEEHPRGNTSRTGGTWDAKGGDSGALNHTPGAGLSNRNGPSDPDDRSDNQTK